MSEPIGDAYQRLTDAVIAEGAEAQRLREAIDEAVELMRRVRGHYGIEECAGPGHPATEWDEIQEAMRLFTYRWGCDV